MARSQNINNNSPILPKKIIQSLFPEINLDDPRRPEGWSDEQWTHYGPDFISSTGDDF